MKKAESNSGTNNKVFEKPIVSKNNSETGASKKINLLSSNELDSIIKGLSRPPFLGSIHLKKEVNPGFNSIEKLIKEELELKLTRTLKNTLFNPITKILILLAIAFNILWVLFVYFL